MANYKDPSTDTAKFVRGFHGDRLGARTRQTKGGQMSSSDMRLKEARMYGLPGSIRGNPLGCGCNIAHLVSAGPVINGEIEANYHCDAQWKNYVVFQVRQHTTDSERGIKIDKFGNLVADEGFQAGELGEL